MSQNTTEYNRIQQNTTEYNRIQLSKFVGAEPEHRVCASLISIIAKQL
jgi:hypothetical protein